MGLFGTLILIGPQTKWTRDLIDGLYYHRDSFDQYADQVLKKRPFRDRDVNENSAKRSSHSASSASSTCVDQQPQTAARVAVTHLNYGTSLNTKKSLSINTQEMSVVRFQARSTEEGYTLLTQWLAPLSSLIGYTPYADRLHSHHK